MLLKAVGGEGEGMGDEGLILMTFDSHGVESHSLYMETDPFSNLAHPGRRAHLIITQNSFSLEPILNWWSGKKLCIELPSSSNRIISNSH